MTDEAKALVEECRLDAKAFRENTVYDSDGDPIRLIANADRLDQYADLIETQAREIERLREALEVIRDGDCPYKQPSQYAYAALAGDSHDQ